jgi:hypothetical protein
MSFALSDNKKSILKETYGFLLNLPFSYALYEPSLMIKTFKGVA